jgi:hypothetical protein
LPVINYYKSQGKYVKFLQKAILVAACLGGGAATAATVPDSYNMLNGHSGTYTYWDDSYSGRGCTTCNNQSLTGGKGDLTDGIIATDNWFVTEAPDGGGPYVGWYFDQTIRFHWNDSTNVDSVTFYLDDANGAGNVSPPLRIVVDGKNFPVADPAGSAPFAFTAGGIGFTGKDLVVSLYRKNNWVFLSEVQFFSAANRVPEPASVLLLLIGLSAAAAAGARRKKN